MLEADANSMPANPAGGPSINTPNTQSIEPAAAAAAAAGETTVILRPPPASRAAARTALLAGPPRHWLRQVALLLIMLAAVVVRFYDLNWDQSQYNHPDERHVTNVISSLTLPSSLKEYFDSGTSPNGWSGVMCL